MRVIGVVLLLQIFSFPGFSQVVSNATYTYTIPTVVDGILADGSYYRSTIMLLSGQPGSTVNASCMLNPVGLTLSLDGTPIPSQWPVSLPASVSWFIGETPGTGPFQSGYITITCNNQLQQVQALISYYAAGGAKLGEATIPGVFAYWYWSLMIDQREGAELGVAIANVTNSALNVTWSVYTAEGTMAEPYQYQYQGTISVPAQSNVSKFLGEVIPGLPANLVGLLMIQPAISPVPAGPAFDALVVAGLRYTGSVFTTIQALNP